MENGLTRGTSRAAAAFINNADMAGAGAGAYAGWQATEGEPIGTRIGATASGYALGYMGGMVARPVLKGAQIVVTQLDPQKVARAMQQVQDEPPAPRASGTTEAVGDVVTFDELPEATQDDIILALVSGRSEEFDQAWSKRFDFAPDGENVGGELKGLQDPPVVHQTKVRPHDVDLVGREVDEAQVSGMLNADLSDAGPVVVRRKPDGGYRIVEGGHRLAVAQRMNEPQIDVIDATELLEQDWDKWFAGDADGVYSLSQVSDQYNRRIAELRGEDAPVSTEDLDPIMHSEGFEVVAYRGNAVRRADPDGLDSPFDDDRGVTYGGWFSDDPAVAATFADTPNNHNFSGVTTRRKLRMNQPLRIDANGKFHDRIRSSSLPPFLQAPGDGKLVNTHVIAMRAKQHGYDGLIIDNVIATKDASRKPSTVYKVFSRDQISTEMVHDDISERVRRLEGRAKARKPGRVFIPKGAAREGAGAFLGGGIGWQGAQDYDQSGEIDPWERIVTAAVGMVAGRAMTTGRGDPNQLNM
ncbi:MAG: hypothetical protein VXW22_14015, partial [Pseudomonadota bacterium]|nr:hypothetical protein [Pseudomonadota bacterium]